MSDEEDNENEILELLKSDGLNDKVRNVLSRLTARETKVLKMKFSIDLSNNHSMEEVSKQFNITRERIRAIEEKALRKLRKQDKDPDDDGPDAA
jgi:RNA polymerase primary sigma factor